VASITYDHVTKRFGNVVAVNDLCLHIEDKEFLVLVGPSGCGKSTALRLLAGLEEATAGTILISDRVVNDVPPKDRDIAMVFQSYALYPHMSVFGNISFGLRMRGMAKPLIKEKVPRGAFTLGIQELLQRKPRELSGGQKQRVALGRAIVREPQVFLMDEPLSNLDAKLRVQTRAELIKLHQQLETTIVYVTHDQVEAMTMGTRIAVLRDGVLQQLDSPQNLYDHPGNRFVAGFIGSPAMNFFDAYLAEEADALFVDTGAFRVPVPSEQAAVVRAGNAPQEVVFGIRPEDIHDAACVPAEVDTRALVQALVDVVEPLGSAKDLNLVSGPHAFTARMSNRTRASAGETMPVVFNMAAMHVFDRVTEEAYL
jgi:multiple sugar transport system ATP-binding protein